MHPKKTGFTLSEFVVSSSISLITMGLGVTLLAQTLQRIHRITLKHHLHQAAESCMAEVRGAIQHAAQYRLPLELDYPTTLPYLHQSAYPGEPQNSCVVLSGYHHKPECLKPNQCSTFGYRLRNQALEKQRSVTSCRGRWERITDPAEICVRQFKLTLLKSHKLLKLQLELSLSRYPSIVLKTERYLCLKDY